MTFLTTTKYGVSEQVFATFVQIGTMTSFTHPSIIDWFALMFQHLMQAVLPTATPMEQETVT